MQRFAVLSPRVLLCANLLLTAPSKPFQTFLPAGIAADRRCVSLPTSQIDQHRKTNYRRSEAD